MEKIKIVTDCTSDLSEELIEKHNIHTVPLIVNIGGKSYKDKEEINTKELFEKVKEYDELPKTSALTPHTYYELFKDLIDQGYSVLYMGIGSGFSSCYQNSMIASEDLPKDKLRIVDSANLSSGIGLLLLKAAKFRDEGNSLNEIADKLEVLVPKVRTMFSIDTLEYLHKGGRCSGTARFFGSMLKIKPIIRVVDGKMVVAKKPRGKYKVALDTQLDYFMHDKDNIDPENIFITHCLAHDEDIEYLKEKITQTIDVKNLHVTNASSVISTHCGPRTIGILYIVD
ncbi:MAG TPA: DegV family protein [Acholeplasmataceae bacterium]|nr:DegV family protein [Acholeplasmataceae bacterium]